MKKITLLFAFLATLSFLNAQTFVDEDFSANQMPPSGWTIDGFASNWSTSASVNAGGVAPEGKFTYSQNIAVTRLISPSVDLTGETSVTLAFSHFYDDYSGAGPKLGVATRSQGGEWTSVWEINPTSDVGPENQMLTIENSDVGQSDFQFCFYLDGNFYNLDYWYVDDIELFIPFAIDAQMISITTPSILNGPSPVTGVFNNKGSNQVTSVDVSWQVDGGDIFTTSFDGLSLDLGDSYDYSCNDLFNFPVGPHVLDVWIANVNGAPDNNPDNDSLTKSINVASFSEQRTPLFEEFTSSTCAPCASFNAQFVPWCNTNEDDIALIKYQMNWPGSGDPYYTDEGGVRRGYYGVTWVPWLVGDGEFVSTDMGAVNSFFSASMDNPSFAAIASSHTLTGTVMDVTTTVLPYAGFDNGMVQVIVFEYETTGNVGNNGETSFEHVMMKMMPDANGTITDFTDREPVTYTQSVDLAGTNVEEWDDLGVIVIVQDQPSTAVYQSIYSVENAAFATDDNLNSMSVDGTPVPDFDPAVLDYYMELPEGSEEVPVVTAEAVDENARVVIVPANELPGTTTIDVFAEDLATHKQYTMSFSLIQGIENPLAAKVKLYPNPTKGILHISGFEKATVGVYTSTGSLVAQYDDFTGGSINVSGLSNGIYFITIQTDENIVTKKVALNR
ncbi:MAG: T9SS type A sorting domain-containing protein [Bacteroidales bacterium]|nr:T9SS type A sorting domain-containing protein [Bacteroidales bacterium]